MGVYIRLFHGRKTPDEKLSTWGSDGPCLGPFAWAHMTYVCEIKLGKPGDYGDYDLLEIVDDLVYYDGVYYGDFTLMDYKTMKADGLTPVKFNKAKARAPSDKQGKPRMKVLDREEERNERRTETGCKGTGGGRAEQTYQGHS